MATVRIRPGLRKSDPKPHSSRPLSVRFGARWRARRRTISCCLSRRFSAITARTPPGATQLRGHDGQVKQGEQEVRHARANVRQTSGAARRCLNPGFSERIANSRRTGIGETSPTRWAVSRQILSKGSERCADRVPRRHVVGPRHSTGPSRWMAPFTSLGMRRANQEKTWRGSGKPWRRVVRRARSPSDGPPGRLR